MDAYSEWRLILPKHMRKDREIKGAMHHQFRSELIQVGDEIAGAENADNEENDRLRRNAMRKVKDIFMKY